MASQYSKPTAPGRRQRKQRKPKHPAIDILHGADDSIDEFVKQHEIRVIDISEMNRSFKRYTNEYNDDDDVVDDDDDNNIIKSVVPELPDLDIDDEPFEYAFDQSIVFDTDDDWESDDEHDHKLYKQRNIQQNDIHQSHIHQSHASIEHFRIKSVTIFGDQLLGSGIGSIQKEIQSQIKIDNIKIDKMDNCWIEKRKFIEDELIETEKHYCSDLNILLNEILIVIFDKKLLDEKYKSQVISNLPEINKFHNEYFLKQLIDGDIIEVFNKSSDFLKMYIEFVNQYQKILDIFAIHGHKTKNKKLYKFLKQKRKEKKPLTNLLIAPIQRIPRYLLLLQDIKKRTPKNYIDYNDIDCALNKVNDITNHINERQREIENMSQCLQIQAKLRGLKVNIVEPHRKFINQFTFNLEKGKKLKLHQFCVFSDTVIITDDKWKVIEQMKLRGIGMKIINHDINGKGFQLNYLKQHKIYYDTNETMDDDVEEIYKIITNNQQTLRNNDLSLFNAGSNAIKSEMERIQNENAEQKRNIMLKQKRNNDNNNNDEILRANTLPLPEKKNIWGRSMKMNENNIMCIEWKFVDDNGDEHCVLLQHQQIKGNPNKKTKRIIKINNVEKFSSNKSNKNKWKFDLNSKRNKNGNKKSVSLNISIKYDSKKNKYSYPLMINGINYPEAFRAWQSANK